MAASPFAEGRDPPSAQTQILEQATDGPMAARNAFTRDEGHFANLDDEFGRDAVDEELVQPLPHLCSTPNERVDSARRTEHYFQRPSLALRGMPRRLGPGAQRTLSREEISHDGGEPHSPGRASLGSAPP